MVHLKDILRKNHCGRIVVVLSSSPMQSFVYLVLIMHIYVPATISRQEAYRKQLAKIRAGKPSTLTADRL
jgi:hypothetical protein